MKTFISLLFAFVSASAFAQVGFQSGNSFQVLDIQGNVQLECRTPNGAIYYQYFQCRGMVAYPEGYDYLVSNTSIDADFVDLTSMQGNGYQQHQSSLYSSKTNQSLNTFNLLIPSYQNPLLSMGMNQINYTFLKNGAPVASGQFMVNVTSMGMHQCFDQTLFDGSGYLCNDPNQACQQYFQQQNWCQ